MNIKLNKIFGETGGFIVMMIILISVIIFAPFLFIYALNTLFPVLAIPYTFDTWCAVYILDLLVRKSNITKNK